jgi:enamine deaminase RidA (YjgF/YER057c/UK114 family)
MAHVRLRKFKTNSWYKGVQRLGCDFCMVVRAGRHVFLRGQTGHDFDGVFHGRGDPGAQAEQAMKNVKTLLREAGSRLDHICKITVYVTDRAYREPVYRVIGKHLQGIYPVSTGLIVNGLARPELMMEIDVDAVIPEATDPAPQLRPRARRPPKGRSRAAGSRSRSRAPAARA